MPPPDGKLSTLLLAIVAAVTPDAAPAEPRDCTMTPLPFDVAVNVVLWTRLPDTVSEEIVPLSL